MLVPSPAITSSAKTAAPLKILVVFASPVILKLLPSSFNIFVSIFRIAEGRPFTSSRSAVRLEAAGLCKLFGDGILHPQ
jgi:hypothetical protein